MQRARQPLQHTGESQSCPEGGSQQDIDEHHHIEATFPLFPRLVQAQLLTDGLSWVNLLKDVQAHLLTHLVIQCHLP